MPGSKHFIYNDEQNRQNIPVLMELPFIGEDQQ